MVVFFSCVITMLYHLGVMQCIISKIAMVMRCTLGTTAAESLCAAGNIFVGQVSSTVADPTPSPAIERLCKAHLNSKQPNTYSISVYSST